MKVETADAEALTEERFLALVDEVRSAEPALSPLGAALLLAWHLGVAADSRDFARRLGVEHALALRELTILSEQLELVAITSRNARTQRTGYAPTVAGERLLARVLRLPAPTVHP
jgi:hypothetical protein